MSERDDNYRALVRAVERAESAESSLAACQRELAEARDHIGIQDAWIRRAVEAASVFQVGGDLYTVANLKLGGSTVVDGIVWLLAERGALKLRAEAAEAERDRYKAAAEAFGIRLAPPAQEP